MTCPDCNGSGAVQVFNIRDDSGDSQEICGMCNGYGHIAIDNDKPKKV